MESKESTDRQLVALDHWIFTIPGLLTPDECEAYIEKTEAMGYTSAPVTTLVGPKMMTHIRNNARVMVDDEDEARWLWARLEGLLPDGIDPQGREAVGLNERLRFYRYQEGQRFKMHMDGYYERDNGERSLLTLMIYLNEGCEGGETTFELMDKTVSVTPKQGMCLLFRHRLRQPPGRAREEWPQVRSAFRCDVSSTMIPLSLYLSRLSIFYRF